MRKTAKMCPKCKFPLRMIDKHENECMWYCDKCKQSIIPQENLRDTPNNTNMSYDFPSGDNSSSFHAASKENNGSAWKNYLKSESIGKILTVAGKLEMLGYENLSAKVKRDIFKIIGDYVQE